MTEKWRHSILVKRRLDRLDDDRIHHIIPTFGREHESNERCWCHPDVKFELDGAIIIHKAEQ